jgi:homoserine kinase type II
MALFTKLDRKCIQTILDYYPDLSQKAFTFSPVAMGTVNTYYKLRFAKNLVYYLKIDEVADPSRLDNEIRVFQNLVAQRKKIKFDFPRPLKTKNQKLTVPFGKKFALIFTEVKGRSLYKKLTPHHLKKLGLALANLNALKPEKKIQTHRFSLMGLQRVFRQIRVPLTKTHAPLAKFIAGKLQTLKVKTKKPLPLSLIHADLFPENVLWQGNRLNGIIDFEAAGRGERLFDIGVALHALCHDGKKFDQRKIASFLSGYLQKTRLTPAEKESFSDFMELTALRFLLTRLRDFELVSANPKDKHFKDYRVYVRRFDELKNFSWFTNMILTKLE